MLPDADSGPSPLAAVIKIILGLGLLALALNVGAAWKDDGVGEERAD